MTRKCYNLTLQTNPWYPEEKTQNSNRHMTARRQSKWNNQLSLPQPDNWKARKDTKYCNQNKDQTHTPHTHIQTNNGRNNKQWINNNRTTAWVKTAAKATGCEWGSGLKCQVIPIISLYVGFLGWLSFPLNILKTNWQILTKFYLCIHIDNI